MIRNAPGLGISGLSQATNALFNIKVKMSSDMVCRAEVAGLNNVCFVRVRNAAAAGPFGGAGFFTQSDASLLAREHLLASKGKFSRQHSRSEARSTGAIICTARANSRTWRAYVASMGGRCIG